MKISTLLSLTIVLVASQSAYGLTYILGDYYASDGSGTVVGTFNTPNTPTEVETTGLYNPSGAAGNPSNYNAIAVGNVYGSGTNYRAVTTFNLADLNATTSGTNAAPSGFEYVVNSVTVTLEVSGGTNDGRPATDIDFYEGDYASGAVGGHIALPGTANGSQLFNVSSGTFVDVILTDLNLDLNTDTQFVFTMDAPDAGSGEFYTFGSGAGTNIGFGGTQAVQLAPVITIDYSIVPIPEPSTGILALLGCSIVGLTYRRRTAA